MGWVLTAVDEDVDDLRVNAWSWRPILGILARDGSVDPELLEAMGFNGDVELSDAEALTVARVLDDEVRRIGAGRVMSDGTVRADAGTGELYRVDRSLNYSVDVETLAAVSEFARSSGGFTCA